MKLENYEVHLPSYSIGSIIYDKIGPVCESYGKTVLVIGGEKALAAAYDKIKAAVDETNLVIIGKEIFGKDCTYQTVERLRSMKLYQLADMVFGVGGGALITLSLRAALQQSEAASLENYSANHPTAPPAHPSQLCTMRTVLS